MEDWHLRIEDKIDAIADKVGRINALLSEQHAILGSTVKRVNDHESRVRGIQRKVHMVEGVLKAVGILGVIAGIVTGLLTVWK